MFSGARDAYVAQINPAGSTLTYAGYLGGDADDRGQGIAIGPGGAVYIAGQTSSTAATFPVTVGPDLTFNGDRDAFVVKIEITGPSITLEGIVNAATFVGGPIAPGEIISIFGVDIGPDPGVNSTFDGEGNVPAEFAGVQVLINGIPAPLYFVGKNQINCQVPYEVDGAASVTVQVIFEGTASNIVTIDVAATAPGLFTLENGIGQVIAVLFPGGTLNSTENPVGPGQIVTLYGTGEGQTAPPGQTGVPVDANALPVPIAAARVLIGGVEQTILYIGGAPKFSGLLQINIELVAGTPVGPAVPIVVIIGGVGSVGALEAEAEGKAAKDDGVVTIATAADPSNQAPAANGQMVMTDEDTPVAMTLTGSDPEGDPLTFTITRNPSNGVLGALSPGGPASAGVSYTPVQNFNGADSFDFQVMDPNGGSSTATVEIEVKPLPDPPVANNDLATVVEETLTVIDVLRNDFDPDGDELIVSSVETPANGTTSTNGATVSYTPDAGFNAIESFDYTISDQNGKALDTATVTVRIVNAPPQQNQDPSANAQSVMTNENVPLPITLSGSDPDGDPLTFTTTLPPANGTLGAITSVGIETATVLYTPNTDYDGPDSFTFQVDDGQGGTATAVVTITVKKVADLMVTKDNGQTMVVPGTQITYTIIVTNAGPSEVVGATVTDTFPAELTNVMWTCVPSTGATCTAGPVAGAINELVDIPAGGAVTYIVTADLPASTPAGTLTNTATVVAPAGIIDAEGNNVATDSDPIEAQADLTISKIDSPDPVVAGTPLTYTLTVNNPGPSDALNVSVADVIPAPSMAGTLTYNAGLSSTECSASGAMMTGDTVTCTVASIPAGGSQMFTIGFDLSSDAMGTLDNSATVSSDTPEANATDNTAVAPTVTIDKDADLQMEKIPAADPVVAGGQVTYTLKVTNHGPSDAESIEVTDTLPAELSNPLAMLPCVIVGAGPFTWTVGNLAAGAMATCDVTFDIASSATMNIANSATVMSTVTPETTNTFPNTAVTSNPVNREADVVVMKTGPAGIILTMMDLFTVTISNPTGPSDVTVQLVDTLPPMFTFVAAGSTLPTPCMQMMQTLTCDPVALPAGSMVTYILNLTAGGVPNTTVTNSATANITDGTETTPVNNTATHDVMLIGLPPVIGMGAVPLQTVGNTRLDVSGAAPPLTPEGEASSTAPVPSRSRAGSRPGADPEASPKDHGGVPAVQLASNIMTLAAVTDPEMDALVFSVSALNMSVGTFIITNAATGEFTYDPPAGCSTTPDTLTYDVTDTFTAPVTGTLVVTAADCIWFVDNSHTPNGDGTSVNPFDKLSDGVGDSNPDDGEDASTDGEDIFVLFGDGTTNNQDSGITLNNDQRLLGEGVELTARNPFTLPASGPPGQSLFPAGNNPLIGGGGLSDVKIFATAADRLGVEVRGLTMTGTGTNGIEVVGLSPFTAEVLITNNQFGTAAEQILQNGILASGSGGWTLAINDNSVVNVGLDGMNLGGTGNQFVTSFSGNTFDGFSSGVGVTMNGVVMNNVTFDADPSDMDFTGDTVPAGGTSIGVSGTPVGMSGMLLTNVSGDVNFGLASGVLDIFATNTGLQANGTGAINAGLGTGFQISVPGGSTIAGGGAAVGPLTEAPLAKGLNGTPAPSNGGAIDLDPMTAFFGGVTLLGQSASFADLGFGSSLTFDAASALSTTSGGTAVFSVNGGDASIVYFGTLSNSGTGLTVDVSNVVSGGMSFGGTITADGPGQGISITNSGALPINFNAAVNLGQTTPLGSTGLTMSGNDMATIVNFNDTLNITTNGADGIVGTGPGMSGILVTDGGAITTTDGTALNISGLEFDLAAKKLEFDTITVNNSGANNGISLQNFTGTADLGLLIITTNTGIGLQAGPSVAGGGFLTTDPGSTINATNGQAFDLQSVGFGFGTLHLDSASGTTTSRFVDTRGRANIMGGTLAGVQGLDIVDPHTAGLELVLTNTTLTGTSNDFRANVASGAALCLSMAGNTLNGTQTIDLFESAGFFLNVVQADAATLSAVNGGATVNESGTITYGAGCLTAPGPGDPFGTPPTAQNDSAMVDEDMTVSINVIDGSAGGLDTDPDMGDIISLRGILTPPTMGTATVVSPTNILYDYTGPFLGLGNSFMDTFVYEITDKAGNIVMATVTVTVNGVAVPPSTAAADSYQTAGNTLLDVAAAPAASGTAKVDVTGTLCSNDTDGGGGLSIVAVNSIADGGPMDLDPAAGSIEVATTGLGRAKVATATCELAYTPPANSGAAGNGTATNSDSFTYDLFNGMGPATVNIAFVNQIWYVDNSNVPDIDPNNDGTSPDPFPTLAALNIAVVVGANDTLFLHDGNSSTTAYTGPIIIEFSGSGSSGKAWP